MSLPEMIEIVPIEKPVRAEITVPGSKSITNRALILAALADGEVTLEGALWSEDTQVMVEALRRLGFEIPVEPDPEEFCNRRITVKGLGGNIPNAGTAEKPLELFVGNAGTAARFLAALVCLGDGVYRLHGVPRMHERPQAALFKALRELGYRIESENNKLPATVYGTGPNPGAVCSASIEESSQFASALMLCARHGGWKIEAVGENAEESPYVAMTAKLIEAFPWSGGRFRIEPDASSGSYFLAAARVITEPESLEFSEEFQVEVPTKWLNNIEVAAWPHSGWQVDERFREFLLYGNFAHLVRVFGKLGRTPDEIRKELARHLGRIGQLRAVSRKGDLGDSIMTSIVLAANEEVIIPSNTPFWYFTDLGRLRLQECERVVAIRTELTKCGAKVVEKGDTLTVYPSQLHGAEIETYNDHRMAMCFAILGLKVPGIKLKNPACVKKTFPNFFQKLAAQPPFGLGATILDAKTGRKLTQDELFAE
jgi:3-phosphoshikimate 1-carboxyvinyltransferase